MSQKVTRKKRLKTSQIGNNLLKTEESDIANYFKDCLTFVPDVLDNVENQLPNIQEDPENEDAIEKTNVNDEIYSRCTGSKSRISTFDSQVPAKKAKSSFSTNKSNTISVNIKRNRLTVTRLSISKSPKSFISSKSNKSNVFNNITESFTSSKILSCQALSNVNIQKRLELSSWGLPPLILEKYQARGVKSMFPWQVECLANKKLLEENRNLVYSAPTSAGKTLVAEFLVLKTVLERRKKAIFILPFVSVVREKMFYFQDLLSDSGVRVEGFMGGVAPPGGFAAVHVAIATIEKANSLVNRLMEDGDLATLGAVVIDELHLLGDPGRGYLLELLLTKLRYMTLSMEHVDIQLIGMSATLPNLPLIAEWLDAELYKTDFRPIPLNEQCKIGSSLFDTKLNVIRELEKAPDITSDTDNIIQLCIETINGGHGILIFCPTKNWCEKLAIQLASTFFQLGRDNTPHGQILRNNIDLAIVQEVLEQLKHCPVGLDSVLKKTVSFGVAFHHAGLTMDERDIIEGAFRVGSLKVLVATSTLSSGVNLPARRVIIRSPIFNGRPLDKLTYQQMIGRAGRMGKDTAGESILICKPSERSAGVNLMTSSLDPIESCLEGSGPLIRALLEAIASQIVRTPKDLEFYSKCTFVYKCDDSELKEMVDEAVKFLIANEFLLLKDVEGGEQRVMATCLGRACLSASIPPGDGLFLFEELQRARKCFVLDTELHVVYLVTPFNAGSQIGQVDWMTFTELWRALSESERRVGQLVGVEERFLVSAMRGIVKPGKALNIHRRFYTAMALHDLVREVPLNAVCRKYNCNRGLLQSLQQSSSTFAGMVTNFCKELKWDCMELLFAQFQARLQFGVCRDLLDLLRLPSLNGLRARSLFKHGITTVAELAVANEFEVEEALNKALPFESEKDFDGENEAEIAKRTKMRTVFITGKDGLTAREAATIVIKEARLLVKNELGACDVQWGEEQLSPRSDTDSEASMQPLSVLDKISPPRLSVEVHAVMEKIVEEPTVLESQENVAAAANSKSDDEMSVFSNDGSRQSNRASRKLSASLVEENTVLPEDHSSKATKVEDAQVLQCNDEISVFSHSATPQSNRNSRKFSTSLVEENNVGPDDHNSSKAPKVDDARLSKCDDDISVFSHDASHQSNRNSRNLSASPIAENNAMLGNRRSKDSDVLSSSSGDVINESDKVCIAASRTLRSRLAEKTKSLLVDDQITVNSIDFESKMDVEQSVAKLTSAESQFQVSERALDEIMQVVEQADAFLVPAPVTDPKKRVSGESNNSNSLFSDSSFLDAQICSVLEQNVGLTCMGEFEKSNFTPQNRVSNKSSKSSEGPVIAEKSRVVPVTNLIENNVNIESQNKQMTWMEDSWDQSKNVRLDKEKNKSAKEDPSDSPSLLKRPRMNTRSKLLAASQAALSKLESTVFKEKTTDSPLIGSPKPILPQRVFDKDDSHRSPIRGVRTYNTRKPILPSVSCAITSDSEDSIVSSQTVDSRRVSTNKIRTKIEQKLVATQKLGKLARVKEATPKVTCTTTTKMLKQNMQQMCDDSSSNDDEVDSGESCLMFDSDDTTKSKPKKVKKNKTGTSSVSKLNPPRAEACIPTCKEMLSPAAAAPVNVANSRRTFRLFRTDIEQRRELAIALVSEPCAKVASTAIGTKIVGIDDKRKKEKRNDAHVYGDRRILGVVFAWRVGAIYYMPFGNSQETKTTMKERMSLLRDIMMNPSISLRCFNAKEIYKTLYVCCEIESTCSFLDPKTGDWLMNSEICNKSYTELVAQYFPKGLDIAKSVEDKFGAHVLTDTARAGSKALLAWYITDGILEKITKENSILLSAYKEIEMPTILILANMELRGFGINVASLQELSTAIKNDLIHVEEEAFSLAGRKFNFYSSKEVSQVLGLTKKGRACTNKNALRSCENPISNLVTLWRKLNTVHTKIVFPLLNLEKKNNRIHGNCITYTVTGRVSMHEPNLQTIPRDFKSEISGCVLSVRMAFIPFVGNVMLSADFCQLELRILAHFSEDSVLCKLLQENGDIFRNIAARLNKIAEDMVDDDMRQRAKQLCYAMIYGMGTKSLAETLSVTESEAKEYLDAFMSTYKGIRIWLNAVSEQVHNEGFVTTVAGRRRYLPAINSKVTSVRAQAERQAVNTKVQGSAADITKKAMVLIESKLRKEFSYLPLTFPTAQSKRKLRCSDSDSRPRGAYLILQLHDELLYEVNSSDLQQVAIIVKESMEQCFQLRVPLPVKVRVGTAWGNLEDYQF